MHAFSLRLAFLVGSFIYLRLNIPKQGYNLKNDTTFFNKCTTILEKQPPEDTKLRHTYLSVRLREQSIPLHEKNIVGPTAISMFMLLAGIVRS
jgi:hypothetical protein